MDDIKRWFYHKDPTKPYSTSVWCGVEATGVKDFVEGDMTEGMSGNSMHVTHRVVRLEAKNIKIFAKSSTNEYARASQEIVITNGIIEDMYGAAYVGPHKQQDVLVGAFVQQTVGRAEGESIVVDADGLDFTRAANPRARIDTRIERGGSLDLYSARAQTVRKPGNTSAEAIVESMRANGQIREFIDASSRDGDISWCVLNLLRGEICEEPVMDDVPCRAFVDNADWKNTSTTLSAIVDSKSYGGDYRTHHKIPHVPLKSTYNQLNQAGKQSILLRAIS